MKKYKIVFVDGGEQKEEVFEARNVVQLSDIFIPKYPKAKVISIKEESER